MRDIINRIQEYLKENIENNEISLSFIAKKFYINQSYLSRLFKQEANETFVEFLSRIRMERAIELLRTTELAAYQIGEKVGIPDPHYFSIFFKKYTNQSISEYRRNLKKLYLL